MRREWKVKTSPLVPTDEAAPEPAVRIRVLQNQTEIVHEVLCPVSRRSSVPLGNPVFRAPYLRVAIGSSLDGPPILDERLNVFLHQGLHVT